VPVLEDTVMQLGCSVVATHVTGDHTIVVGKVEDAEIHGGEPLLFFRGEYRHIGGEEGVKSWSRRMKRPPVALLPRVDSCRRPRRIEKQHRSPALARSLVAVRHSPAGPAS